MKVNRQGYQERYPTTVEWVKDFTRTVEGTPSFLNNIKSLIIPNGQKFSSIEEKMADIKKRIGFDLVGRESAPDFKIATIATIASIDGKKASMESILKYIESMIKHEPNLSAPVIISKCRQAEGLNFDDLPIDMEKLREFIEYHLAQHQGVLKTEVSYVPADPISHSESEMDNEADYYKNTHSVK